MLMMRRKCKFQPLTKTILKESIELKPGYRPPSPETLKNRDVFEEPTGKYSRRVSGEGGLCRGGRLALS